MARVTRMTAGDCRERAASAAAHLLVAEELLTKAESGGGRSADAQVAASNAVLAAIAAADAICGTVLGERSNDQDHKQAREMLMRSTSDGPTLAKRFGAVVARKSQLQYGGFCSVEVATQVVKQTAPLVGAALRMVR